MLFRIVFNIIYINSIFGSNDILKFTIPSSMFVNLILVCTLMLTKVSEHFDILLLKVRGDDWLFCNYSFFVLKYHR